jgi:hypothetical protein
MLKIVRHVTLYIYDLLLLKIIHFTQLCEMRFTFSISLVQLYFLCFALAEKVIKFTPNYNYVLRLCVFIVNILP